MRKKLAMKKVQGSGDLKYASGEKMGQKEWMDGGTRLKERKSV